MAALRWSTAGRIAVRELRASKSKFLFVVLSVAIGVAALTGVRGFATAFRQTLTLRARSILAADLSARLYTQPSAVEEKQIADMEKDGVLMTPVTEMAGMATAANAFDPLLVAVKAVDPDKYPFYGEVELSPAMSLAQALHNGGVAVGEDLLIRLRLKVGDRIKLGQATLRIAATVVSEPDRLSGAFAAGPRVLLSREELEKTELVAPGSRAGQRFLFRLPVRDDAVVAKLKTRVEGILPEANVTDYRETNPAVTTALDRSTSLLSLVSLVALVLGAVGVAMAMRTHLLERMDTIAIMKSLGAQSGHILRIYFLETSLLGIAGGIVGVLLGVGVQMALPAMVARVVGVRPDLHVSSGAIFAGLATGLLTTVLFTLPPLLDVRKIRPVRILRRAMEDEAPESWWPRVVRKLSAAPIQIAAGILIFAGLAIIATMLSGSRQVGLIFTLGLMAVLLVLIAASALLLWLLRVLLRRTRMVLPPVLRHGLANLYRPGNPSASLLAAVGLGVMLIVAVYMVQGEFVRDLRVSTRPDLPNVFLIDIAKSEVEGMRALLKRQSGMRGEPELLPVVSSRISAIDGVPAAQVKLRTGTRRSLQNIQLTWSDGIPPGTTVVSGKFWNKGETAPFVAVGAHTAERLGVKVGSLLTFSIAGTEIVATVIALVHSDGQHVFSRADFFLPPSVLENAPVTWYGGVHMDPSHVGELQRALFLAYPTVTVINVAQALENLRNILQQVTLVVEFLAGFSIFAGLVILASAIAGTRYRRMREVVVLKTLGGTRTRIAGIFSIEFATLGLVAGVVGVVFANLVTRAVLKQMDLPWSVAWITSTFAILLTAVMTVGAGWAASFRVLGQKPLEVLREE
jgi:putative ABC transport system permease protein